MSKGLNLVETVLVVDSCAQGMSVPEICSTYGLKVKSVREAMKANGLCEKPVTQERPATSVVADEPIAPAEPKLEQHKERVCAMFVDDDRSANYIARKLGVSHGTVVRALKRWGMPAATHSYVKSCEQETEATNSRAVELCAVQSQEPSSPESGVVGPTTVRMWLRSGVVLRKREDAQVANDVREESMGVAHV